MIVREVHDKLVADLTVKENIQVVADITKEPLDIDEVMEAVIRRLNKFTPAEVLKNRE